MTLTLEQVNTYQNKWVAFAGPDQAIVGSGKTLQEAKQEAVTKGYAEPIFFKVPPDAYFIPSL